mgnify:CR=1 FL=1
MGVKVLKSDAKTDAVEQPAFQSKSSFQADTQSEVDTNDPYAMIDELGALEEELATLSQKKKKADALKTKIRKALDIGIAPDEDGTEEGQYYRLTFGAKGVERTVADKMPLIEILGESTFVSLANFRLTDLDKYLTEDEKARVITQDRTGSRSLKVSKK